MVILFDCYLVRTEIWHLDLTAVVYISEKLRHGQIRGIEQSIKNPFHLALRPQYHWTDQKIEVHGFICLFAFLLCMVAYRRAKENANFKGSPHKLIKELSAIRLATFIENPSQKTKGRYKTVYRLEEIDEDLYALAEAIGLTKQKIKTNIPFSVYK